jgi:MoxR-like ATPase
MISVLTDDASHVVWLAGPTQCGKTKLVHHVGRELGRKVFQINCRGDMGSEIFFGEKTIVVDPVTKQNMISFQRGIVEQALTEGLDEQGNEVGAPGLLFIDEAAAMPAHVDIGINRLLESDDTRRTFVIDQDGGRVVRGHSKLRIIMAANTVGRGATGVEASAYSAQQDALDISLLNRIAVCFRMGYDKEVERHILVEKIGDDRVAALVIKFRDAIRDHIRQGKLISPFSTAHIVHIADMYRVFGDLGKAIYSVTFELLLPEEKALYNEQAMAILGHDLLKKFTQKNIDYM